MTLSLALVISLLVEVMSAVALLALGARLGLAADRRFGIEGELALGTAIAEFRVTHDSAMSGLPPRTTVVLPAMTVLDGWDASAIAERPDSQELVVLKVLVRRVGGSGHLVAGRQGTLLLSTGTADTAIVIGHWPRF